MAEPGAESVLGMKMAGEGDAIRRRAQRIFEHEIDFDADAIGPLGGFAEFENLVLRCNHEVAARFHG